MVIILIRKGVLSVLVTVIIKKIYFLEIATKYCVRYEFYNFERTFTSINFNILTRSNCKVEKDALGTGENVDMTFVKEKR